ncbi:MAG: metal ABC transporter substrate-binding protein [Bacillota bacterium]
MRKRMPVFLFSVFVVISLLWMAAGCSDSDISDEEEQDIIEVVTTIHPLGDIAAELGGDKVAVTYLLPAGASPHTYEPTVEQARKVDQADLFFYIGAGLDNWALEMTDAADEDLIIADISENVPLIEAADYEHFEDEHENHNHDHDHDHGPGDPHYWLDPIIVRDSVLPVIHEKYVKLIPDQEAYFDQRYDEYQQELTLLHEEIQDAVSGFTQHSFLAFHSAWQYFARRYELKELAVIARFPGQEPSAGRIAELVELIKEEDIGAIFTEPQFAPGLADSVAEESGIEVYVVDPLGGEGLEGRESYLEMMRFNLAVFKEALEN